MSDPTLRLRDEPPAAIVALALKSEQDLGEQAAVGIGTSGSVSRVTDSIRNANSTYLNGRPLKQDGSRSNAACSSAQATTSRS